ncbi:hypothetical protein QT971_31950, partial [Microcoleus sp. herbarium19]|uniref:hypothetical protein n=1 Tax=unclassified Microcoleus TaxID=2642155 RepID=UPI002FD0FB0E
TALPCPRYHSNATGNDIKFVCVSIKNTLTLDNWQFYMSDRTLIHYLSANLLSTKAAKNPQTVISPAKS